MNNSDKGTGPKKPSPGTDVEKGVAENVRPTSDKPQPPKPKK